MSTRKLIYLIVAFDAETMITKTFGAFLHRGEAEDRIDRLVHLLNRRMWLSTSPLKDPYVRADRPVANRPDILRRYHIPGAEDYIDLIKRIDGDIPAIEEIEAQIIRLAIE